MKHFRECLGDVELSAGKCPRVEYDTNVLRLQTVTAALLTPLPSNIRTRMELNVMQSSPTYYSMK